MTDSRLRDLVFQALGEASMCWSERPKGVFDDVHAVRIGEDLLHAIEAYTIGVHIPPKRVPERVRSGYRPVPVPRVRSIAVAALGSHSFPREDSDERRAQRMAQRMGEVRWFRGHAYVTTGWYIDDKEIVRIEVTLRAEPTDEVP